MLIRLLLLLTLSLSGLFSASVSALELNDDIEGILLGKHLAAWAEPANTDIEPLLRGDIHSTPREWTPSASDIPNPGVSSPPHWYRLDLTLSEATIKTQWIAEVLYPRTERIDLLMFHQGELVLHEQRGNPVHSPLVRTPELSFEFELPLHRAGDYTLYFRVENNALLNLPLKLYHAELLADERQDRLLFFGVFSGFLLAILFYNLALNLVIRERYLFYFCGFVFFYLTFFWAHTGVGYRYLWQDFPIFEERGNFITSAIAMLFIALFTHRFLEPGEKRQRLGLILRRLAIVIGSVTVVLVFAPSLTVTINAMKFNTLALPLLLILIAACSGNRRSPSNLVYGAGVVCLGASIIVHSLTRQGFLPSNFFTAYSSHFGAVSVIAIHSVAIVLRLYEQRLEQKRTRLDMLAARDQSRRNEEKLRRSEANLAQTEAEAKSKSAFLAMMSHEIRTPLNGVLGMVELLQHTRLNAQQKRYVDTIAGSGESLLSLLNDVLDLSKIESGKMTIEKRDVALPPLLNDSIMLYSRLAKEKGLTLTADIGDHAFQIIQSDDLRLRQVLNNLLNNAIKFTERGHVHVQLHWQPETLTIDIADTGIGISEEQQQRLFESFTQADDQISRQYGGTGLGLTICQRLTMMLGGRIEVRSSPGVGSVFSIILDHPQATQPLTYNDLNGRRVFIDVSSTHERDCLERWLSRANIEFAGGRYDTPLDLIITDAQINTGDRLDQHLVVVDSPISRLSLDRQVERPLRSHVLLHHLNQLLTHSRLDEEVENTHRSGTVWIAEDNLVNQKVISGMLRHLGMTCELFGNGQEIVSAFKERPDVPDLILMDCEMPVLDGYDATRAIRSLQTRTVPIIALTAHLGREFEEDAQLAGMDDLITKPVRKQTLIHLFQQFMPH